MINRRESLRLIAGTAAALAVGTRFAAPARADAAVLTLTPEEEEGPFYIDAEHLRSNIAAGKPGIPLDLRIAVLDLKSQQPLTGAAIDIWHCDAAGVYSGYENAKMGPPPGTGGHGPPPFGDHPPGPPPGGGFPEGGPPGAHFAGMHHPHHLKPNRASTALRGIQITDAQGVAAFSTIYPGWYAGREIHIHLKVHVGGSPGHATYAGGHVCHTGQLFFPDETNQVVSQQPPYVSSKTPRTTKATDHVYLQQHGDQTLVNIHPRSPSPLLGYLATIVLAVDPTATPKPHGFG